MNKVKCLIIGSGTAGYTTNTYLDINMQIDELSKNKRIKYMI
ncbi:hypothetical protein [Polaribacter vadi]|tara:strand:- start:38937 stop:39062 length:126 start_codon:yes stop_codon:yes gene_type:complete